MNDEDDIWTPADAVTHLRDHGLPAIPVLGKRPAYKNWTDPNKSPPQRFLTSATGVGLILGRGVVALDIDTLSEDISKNLIGGFDFCLNILVRRGHPNKAVVLLKLSDCQDDTVTKRVTPTYLDAEGNENKIELLASGQQVVLFGAYPDIPGRDYEWTNGHITNPMTYSYVTEQLIAGNLPEVSVEQLERLTSETFQRFEQIAKQRDWTPLKDIGDGKDMETVNHRQWSSDEVSDDDIQTALGRIDPDIDRDTWRDTVFGLHDWYSGSSEGFEIALSWSRGDYWNEPSSKHKPGDVDAVWNGAKSGGGRTIGTVFHVAGWSPTEEVTEHELDTAFAGFESVETDDETGVYKRGEVSAEELAEVKTSTKAALKVMDGFNHTIGEILGDPDRDYATEFLNKAAIAKACRLVAWNAVHNKFTCFARNSDPGWVIEEKRAHAQIPDRLRRSGIHLFKEGAREHLMALVEEAVFREDNITGVTADKMRKIASQAAVARILDYAAANRRFISLTQRETLRPQTAIGLDVYFDPRKSVMRVNTKIKLPDIHKYAKWANDAVWDDYREHFPELEDLLRFIVAIRVNENGKRGFVFIQASSDFGKSELIKIISVLGICTEIDQAEMDRLTKGQPSGLSPRDFVTSWVLALDEFRSMNDQAKQWSDDISVNVKYGSNSNAPVYTKLFTSADPISSFDDPSEQLLNRFSYINRTSSGSIKHRPVFKEIGENAYRQALFYHIGRFLNAEMQHYLSLPQDAASKKSYEEIETFRSKHPLTGVEDAIENRIDELAYEFLDWLRRRLDDVLSSSHTDRFVREHCHTVFDKDGNPMDVDGSIVVGITQAKQLFEKFLSEEYGNRKGRLVLHFHSVVEHISVSGLTKVRCRLNSPTNPYRRTRLMLIKADTDPAFASRVGVNDEGDLVV